jgi:hypothetical protein
MTPEPTAQDETANDNGDSPADGIKRDHADQQEREHHQGCAALSGAVTPCDHNSRSSEGSRAGEARRYPNSRLESAQEHRGRRIGSGAGVLGQLRG